MAMLTAILMATPMAMPWLCYGHTMATLTTMLRHAAVLMRACAPHAYGRDYAHDHAHVVSSGMGERKMASCISRSILRLYSA